LADSDDSPRAHRPLFRAKVLQEQAFEGKMGYAKYTSSHHAGRFGVATGATVREPLIKSETAIRLKVRRP